MGKQIKLLKYHTHLLAKLVNAAGRICYVIALKPDLSPSGLLQPVQAAQEGRLSGPRGTDDYNFLSLFYLLVYAVKYHVIPERFLKIFNLYHSEPASFP